MISTTSCIFNRRQGSTADRERVMTTLQSKCEFKAIAVPTIESIRTSPLVEELRVSWPQMLGHQLPQLPSFDDFWEELRLVFDWLFGRAAPVALPVAPAREAIDTSWQLPAMASSWRGLGVSAPLEVIRFAAANRLRVELDYEKESGERTQPIIEPYSLRRTREGNLLLYGVRSDNGEDRSYRVDRILGASATTKSFHPRYVVELTAVGPVEAPPTASRSESASTFRAPAVTRARKAASGGPVHVFRCTVCGKTFRRSTYDAVLNSHKNKQGQPCFGRFGSHVRTEY